jgi:hypothetical protein
MLSLIEWQTFFSVHAECAATLTGLVFVAVSINLKTILNSPGLPGRAAESLAQFLQVFFICSAVLIPGQSAEVLAAEVMVIAFLGWALQTASQVAYARSRSGHPKSWLLTRITLTQLGSIPLFVGAVSVLKGSSTGIYWLLPGFFVSFLAGILNAWILLIEILR